MDNNVIIIGYALLGAKELGSSKVELALLESVMRLVLDEYNEDEAIQTYRNN